MSEPISACNCANFATNLTPWIDWGSAQLQDAEISASKLFSVSSFLQSFGAEFDSLTLDSLPALPSVALLGEAISQCHALRSAGFSVCSGKGRPYPPFFRMLVGVLAACPLRRLSIGKLAFGDLEARAFAAGVSRSSEMECVELFACSFQSAEVVELICKGLSLVPTLESVSFSRNFFAARGTEKLVECLPPQVRNIAICWQSLGISEARILGHTLASRTHPLESLDIQGNRPCDDGSSAIFEGVIQSGSAKYLRRVNVDESQICNAGDTIARLVELSPRLYSLCLSSCTFSPEAGEKLGRALRTCVGSMRELSIGGCQLGAKGIVEVCKSLAKSRVLVSLNMHTNFAGTAGAKAVAECLLPDPGAIEVLEMRNNKVDDEAGLELAKGLRKNSTLRVLDLSVNEIQGTVAASLIDSIGPGIVTLNLYSNQISDPGAAALARLISRTDVREITASHNAGISAAALERIFMAGAKSRSIECLRLQGNSVERSEKRGAEEMTAAIAKCLTEGRLRVLDLRGIKFGTEGATALAEAIGRCEMKPRGDVTEVWIRKSDCGKTGVGVISRAVRGMAWLKVSFSS